MGGLGSTRWGWTSTKGTVEGVRSLDINCLNKAGCLRPGYWGGWEWTRDGERMADIGLRAEAQRLILSYRLRLNRGGWQDVEQPTPVVWLPCPFGGERPYFVCRGVVNGVTCSRQVLKLYGADTYFLCRHCYQLAYASQREDRCDRALRRADKIRMRLGGEPGMASVFPVRPKGMHRRTYERLQSEMEEAEILADERLALALERLQRMDRGSRGRSRRSVKEFRR
jgi:hypothetical protein